MVYNFKHHKNISLSELKSDIDRMDNLTAEDLPLLLTASRKTAELYYNMVKNDNSQLNFSQEINDIKNQILSTYDTASQYYNATVAKNRSIRLSAKPNVNRN